MPIDADLILRESDLDPLNPNTFVVMFVFVGAAGRLEFDFGFV